MLRGTWESGLALAVLMCPSYEGERYYFVIITSFCLDGRRLPNKFLRKCKSNCFVRAITLS